MDSVNAALPAFPLTGRLVDSLPRTRGTLDPVAQMGAFPDAPPDRADHANAVLVTPLSVAQRLTESATRILNPETSELPAEVKEEDLIENCEARRTISIEEGVSSRINRWLQETAAATEPLTAASGNPAAAMQPACHAEVDPKRHVAVDMNAQEREETCCQACCQRREDQERISFNLGSSYSFEQTFRSLAT